MAKSKIIKELANNQISMEVALQRLMIIASDLENEDLSAWAEAELHGYSRSDTLPKYRNIQSIHFVYSGINVASKLRIVRLPLQMFWRKSSLIFITFPLWIASLLCKTL